MFFISFSLLFFVMGALKAQIDPSFSYSPPKEVHPLYHKIYRSPPPSSFIIPTYFENMTFFVYDLPEKFNVDLINRVEKLNGVDRSPKCTFFRKPCYRYSSPNRYVNGSEVQVKFGLEVLLLSRLLLLPQTSNPEEADLFIVPAFLAMAKYLNGCPWFDRPCPKHHLFVADLFYQLEHFWFYPKKHLLLDTRDFLDSSHWILASGPILAHTGPRNHGCQSDLVVPYADVGMTWEREIIPLSRPSTFLFWMGSPYLSQERRALYEDLYLFKRKHFLNDRDIFFGSMSRSKGSLSTHRTMGMYASSFLCPILKGKLPQSKQFFDAFTMGCLPVVLVEKENIYFKADNRTKQDTLGADLLPFRGTIPWEDIVVEIPYQRLSNKTIGKYLFEMDRAELTKRRELALEYRKLVQFSWKGDFFDVFSAYLQQMSKLLTYRYRLTNCSRIDMYDFF